MANSMFGPNQLNLIQMPATTHRLELAIGLVLLMVCAWAAYMPGLSGGFLFDDFVNLNAIGATGPVDDWATFWRYVTSGSADPTGRPLAMLSFLVDARDWPAAPAPFLRTNLVLHLVNGVLLFALLRALGRWLTASPARNDAAALLAAGLWLLHPLFVSTTLYVVQRQAMLPATFILLGLLAYVHGRNLAEDTRGERGVPWMIAGIVLGTGLAMLCKGNGILLPSLALVLEFSVLKPRGAEPLSPRVKRWRTALLVVPSAALMLYLLSFASSLHTPLGHRPWTIAQRLLTEPRVLLDYLQLLAIPRSISTGLYNDDYVASANIWQPMSTLPSLLVIVALILLGLRLRHRAPVWSAALLFFFVGHLLESSAIPLELYFEHRNYIPAMLLFWPPAVWLVQSRFSTSTRTVAAIALLALFATTTFHRASLWGSPERLAALWAKQNPESSRAQATHAIQEIASGNARRAVRTLDSFWREKPYDLQIALNYANAACASDGLSADESRRLGAALRNAAAGVELVHSWLDNALDVAAAGTCKGLGLPELESWIAAASENPAINNPHVFGQDIEPLLAQVAIQRKQPKIALEHFDRALESFTTPDMAARQVSILASNGYFEQALAHLDTYERIKERARPPGRGMAQVHAMVLEWQGYWPHEMTILRRRLRAEIAARDFASEAD